jgi:hypothetical protein
MGYQTIAKGNYQLTSGRYNIEDLYNEYAFVVGNGDGNTRGNALTIDWGGKVKCNDKLSCQEVLIRVPTQKETKINSLVVYSHSSQQLYNIDLILNKTYEININGKISTHVAKYACGYGSYNYPYPMYYIGNLIFNEYGVSNPPDTGEDFLIYYRLPSPGSSGEFRVINKSSSSITLSLYEWKNEEEIELYNYVKDFNAKESADTKTGTSNKLNTKLYLVGSQSQDSNGTETFSSQNCYIGTDNSLYSNGEKVLTSSGSALPVSKGGTGYTSIEDTSYTIARYRASTLISNPD